MEAIRIPITGELDLHIFQPKEVKSLVCEYILACRDKKIFTLRIIHGKGQGVLRRTVHSILSKNSLVESFALAQADAGGWGVTIVNIKRDAVHDS